MPELQRRGRQGDGLGATLEMQAQDALNGAILDVLKGAEEGLTEGAIYKEVGGARENALHRALRSLTDAEDVVQAGRGGQKGNPYRYALAPAPPEKALCSLPPME